MDFKADLIDSPKALDSIRLEWSTLYEASGASPFQSPEWLIPWWRHLGRGELFTIRMSLEGELTMIAPLYIFNDKGVRELSFMGDGVSDYLDIISAPHACFAARAFYRALAGERPGWDRCVLREVPVHSRLLYAPSPDGLRIDSADDGVCPVLTLPDEIEKCHVRATRAWKALKRAGDLRAELAEESTLARFMEDLFTLHARRWEKEGGPGVLHDEAVRSFHLEAASGLLKKGVLRLYRLVLNSCAIAAVYGFVKGSRFYSYLGGFDPVFERYSPGRALMGYVIGEAAREGVREFDFLRGRERYKYAWGARDRVNARLTLTHAHDR